MIEYKLLNDSILASRDEKGVWIYKSNPQAPFKKNGNLKKEYKDLPRFPAIVEYEREEMKDFDRLLHESIKDISIKLLSFNK
jgi:hypothetical protein